MQAPPKWKTQIAKLIELALDALDDKPSFSLVAYTTDDKQIIALDMWKPQTTSDPEVIADMIWQQSLGPVVVVASNPTQGFSASATLPEDKRPPEHPTSVLGYVGYTLLALAAVGGAAVVAKKTKLVPAKYLPGFIPG